MSILRIEQLHKRLNNAVAVDDISFIVPRLQHTVIAGSTGSGKTTLLKMIAGLIQPDGGNIFLFNNRLPGPEEKLMPGHDEIAYLSQHFELRNNYRVEEIMEYSNKISEEEAGEIFRICRIDQLLKRKSNELSGGEKQRTALARLLITNPSVLLLDEPFSNLDGINKKIVQKVLKDIAESLELTIIMVSHDPEEILSWAEQILILRNGKLVEQGSPEQLYRYPLTEYSASLLGGYQILPDELTDLLKLPALKTTENVKWMIRPEKIKLSLSESILLKGETVGRQFFGSYYLVDLRCRGQMLSVNSPVDFLPGTQVGIIIDRSDCCRISVDLQIE